MGKTEKNQTIEVEGHVTDILSNNNYEITLGDGHRVLGYLGGKMRINHIRVIKGDRVLVELSPYDLNRGRVTFRFK
ncbi:MAG: translation initiation factor IF-1 [Chloroflexi bacterium]|nr:translation initiation factor IF-1 [Chloroflexota bacterium]